MSRLTFAVGATIALATIVLVWRGRESDPPRASLEDNSRKEIRQTSLPRRQALSSRQQDEKRLAPSRSDRETLATTKNDVPAFENVADKVETEVEAAAPTIPPSVSLPKRKLVVTRLPAVDQPPPELLLPRQDLTIHRLPSIAENPRPESPQLGNAAAPPVKNEPEERDLVLFAAGAVRLHPPQDWHLSETPYGRQLRLVITPQPRRHRRMPRDGVWLTYHPWPIDDQKTPGDLAEMSERHLSQATDGAGRSTGRRDLRLGRWHAVREDFTIEASSSQQSPYQASRGFHLLARTTWGTLELHAVAPASQWQERSGQFERLVAGITLHQPKQRRQIATDSTRDAEAILGYWKANRSRFQLYGDGRIAILLDPLETRALDAPPEKKNLARREQLHGRYEARGDLLIVTWDDGSKSNYRWRLQGRNLLLTDNEGRVSQLLRYFQ